LGVEPASAVVVEDAVSGGNTSALEKAGADVVVLESDDIQVNPLAR
jgi:beta-phosphoglucomutase-like phosphatase (HAD superfamily)